MEHVVLALAVGLVTGATLGLLGAGGSVLTVPAFVYLLGQPVAAATAASLVIVSGNAAVGAADNARRGTVDRGVALRFGAAGIAGAAAGTALARLASGATVLFLLAIVMLGAAWSLWRGGPGATGGMAACVSHRAAAAYGLGLAVGALTGFFGVGGGFLIVPALVLLLGVPVRVAIGTSLAVIAVTALAGLGGRLATGGVPWPVTLAFAGAGVAGVLAGTRAASHVRTEALSRGFAAMLVAVAAFLLVKNGAAIVT